MKRWKLMHVWNEKKIVFKKGWKTGGWKKMNTQLEMFVYLICWNVVVFRGKEAGCLSSLPAETYNFHFPATLIEARRREWSDGIPAASRSNSSSFCILCSLTHTDTRAACRHWKPFPTNFTFKFYENLKLSSYIRGYKCSSIANRRWNNRIERTTKKKIQK